MGALLGRRLGVSLFVWGEGEARVREGAAEGKGPRAPQACARVLGLQLDLRQHYALADPGGVAQGLALCLGVRERSELWQEFYWNIGLALQRREPILCQRREVRPRRCFGVRLHCGCALELCLVGPTFA